MADYSVQAESTRILFEHILGDATLDLPASITEAAQLVSFVGEDSQPFIASPCKLTESASSLTALVAVLASALCRERYGVPLQKVEINTEVATLFTASLMLPKIDGKPALQDERLGKELAKGDLYEYGKPLHAQCSSVYKTRDGRWYHLHASLNAAVTLDMLGVPEQDVTAEEANAIFEEKVLQWDAAMIEETVNDKYKQAGVTCYTPEEFFASEHGKIMGGESLWTKRALKAPRTTWPATVGTDYKPLAGIKVLDVARVIAAPVVSKMLALLGADVLKISSSKLPDLVLSWIDISSGKRDADLDLKSAEGTKVFAKLIKDADVLIDGFRPGALAKLGFDTISLRKLNPSLVYLRENCYGFKGPLSGRSGWQQISDCLVGISWLQGKFLGLDEPVVPLLPNSDYQTGLVGAAAVLQALIARSKDDVTYDIDISLTQYNIWYYRLGQYTPQQAAALLKRNEGFSPRHSDSMSALMAKTLAAITKISPNLVDRPDYYTKMSGKEWGLDEDISILRPAMTMEKSKLEYTVPSGPRGRSEPEWLAVG